MLRLHEKGMSRIASIPRGHTLPGCKGLVMALVVEV